MSLVHRVTLKGKRSTTNNKWNPVKETEKHIVIIGGGFAGLLLKKYKKMKHFLVPDGPRRDANPSPEQMESGIKPFQDLTDGDASQGGEFALLRLIFSLI